MKRKSRIVIDIAMTVMMPLLMAYSLIGELFHEIVGSLIFVLFIVHHILNRRWALTLTKGKYDARRIFRTVLNALLFVFMILQPVSGILMSKHVYTFLPELPVSALARSVHMLLAYWGYVLLSLHTGTHMRPILNAKIFKGRRKWILYAVVCAVSVYGIIAFINREFPGYMFGRTMFAFFDPSEPILLFFADYIAIMILFMAVGCLVM